MSIAENKMKVAIVMPVYNASKFLTKTVQAILDQSYPNWVLFAVDDGSTDDSLNILKKFTDPRIKVYECSDYLKLTIDESGVIHTTERDNRGPAYARNKALDAIRASNDFDFIAYCDSDDRWKSNHLIIALNLFAAALDANITDLDMVYSDCDFSFEDGTPAVATGVPYYEHFERANLLKQNFIYISTVVHKTKCLTVGNFDESAVPQEDYDMWLRISKVYGIKHNKIVTSTYMFKDGGSYYTNDQSMKSQLRLHIKHYQVATVLEELKQQLVDLQKMKTDLVRIQQYEDAARLRDVERQVISEIDKKAGPQSIEGWLSPIEGEALAKYAEGKDCLEIGSYKGKSANYIASTANSLVCIDSFRADASGQTQDYANYTTIQEFLKNISKFNNITPVIGFSNDVHTQFKDNQFDLIFIDGMHEFASVQYDIVNYWPKLKIGGMMCFHDYTQDWPGVIKAVNENFGWPDTRHDSIAAVRKKYDKIQPPDTLREQYENKFLLMNMMNMSSDEIDKLPYNEFLQLVRTLKEKMELDKTDLILHDAEESLKTSKDALEYILGDTPRVIKKIVVICPFSHKLSNGEENAKNYPYWDELVHDLKGAGCYIQQIGVTGENFIGADEVIFNASFDRLKDILDNADTFISVDSFFPHFAHYHGKHGVVIFSQSDPNLFGYPENLNIIKSREYLRKEQFWLWSQAKYNKEAFISSKDVLRKVLEIL